MTKVTFSRATTEDSVALGIPVERGAVAVDCDRLRVAVCCVEAVVADEALRAAE